MTKTINTHDQLIAAREANQKSGNYGQPLPDVAICPNHWHCGRSTYVDGWNVYRPGKIATGAQNDDNPWGDAYGCRVFSERDYEGTWREARKQALAAAMEWAGKHYGVEKWVRNRAGDYVDSRVNELFPIRRGK